MNKITVSKVNCYAMAIRKMCSNIYGNSRYFVFNFTIVYNVTKCRANIYGTVILDILFVISLLFIMLLNVGLHHTDINLL